MPTERLAKSIPIPVWLLLATWVHFELNCCAEETAKTVRMQIAGPRVAGGFARYRQILVSPTVNTPKPFQGFGGFCGWPKICRLQNGELFVAFSAGYWHASWPTPLEKYDHPEYAESIKKRFPFIRNWKAPDGGHMMWIKSRDRGKTWTRPRTFPIIPGAYGITDVYQLKSGTMVAVALIEHWHGLRSRLPAKPVEFAKATMNRLPNEQVFFRSRDNGETWKEVGRLKGPFLFMTTSHDFAQASDGSLLLLTAAVPIPQGKGWGANGGRFVSLLMRSKDEGTSWKVVSIIGDNRYNVEEGAIAFLPDGTLGFASRPTSAWFSSRDGGKRWSKPLRIHTGTGKIFKKGDFVVTGNTAVLLFCGGPGRNGQVIYSRDSAKTWIKPAPDRGFQFDSLAYYPDACVLGDGSIFAVGDHQGFKNKFGPYGAEVTAMRFRIKTADEGEGIELLPIGGPPVRK